MEESKQVAVSDIKSRFLASFTTKPEVLIKAPGRVNLIGEYTDLNQGFVMPMAIDRYLIAAVSQRDDEKVRICSMDYDETIEISLDSISKKDHAWCNYVSGCLWILQKTGYTLRGFDCVITGSIPVGAGLSSSAALEIAILRAAAWTADIQWNEVGMAKMGQQVENQWIGVQSGIMDQIIISAGKANNALLFDCRDLSFKACPIPDDSTVIILDTSTRRGLVDSQYNVRREECFKAAEVLKVSSLREANLSMLEAASEQVSKTIYNRAKHVITENTRVKEFAECMKSKDTKDLGDLMIASHLSLKNDFQVTNEALNIIVECAIAHESSYGARMTGAGFGGCAVALIKKGSEEAFIKQVSEAYHSKMQIEPNLYACKASSGVSVKSFPADTQ